MMDVSYAILTLKISGETKEFKVLYDQPLMIKEIKDAFQEWIQGEGEDDSFTVESLVKYIKSKYPKLNVFTEEKFNQLLKDYDLTVTPIDGSLN